MSTLTTTTTATTATVYASLQPQSADPLLADLFASYYSARSNKRNTASQIKFERRLSENIISLYEDVRARTRRHLDRRWTEALCTESDPYVLLSVWNAREGFLKHFDGGEKEII